MNVVWQKQDVAVRSCFYTVLGTAGPGGEWCLRGQDKTKYGEEAVTTTKDKPPSIDGLTTS